LKKLGVKYTIAENQYSVDPVASATIATNELTAHPDINMMWSDGGDGVAGIITALKQQGKTKSIMVFGIDVLPAETTGLLDGSLIATTGQDAVAMGTRAYDIMNSGRKSSPFTVSVPGVLYSQDDLAAVREYVSGTS
jgi:ABC-type sugar transport system substrate-binding protein